MKRFFILCSILLISCSFALVNAQNIPFQRLDVFDLQWVDNPQISPDGEKIVYQRRGMDIMSDRRTSSLWLINTDGSEHQKLTSFSGNESQPRWSPDGKRIAFTTSADNHGSELFVYWIETGTVARITQLERGPANLSWSPDGRYIAFTMKIEESNPVLVNAPKKPEGANWAPVPRVTDRFKYEQDGAGYIDPGFTHIFMVNADGGAVRQITSGKKNYGSNLVWTPDGQALIISANLHEKWERERRNSEIYSISIETGEAHALTNRFGPDHGPALSPDGRLIAYIGYEDKIQTYQVSTLNLMNLDGSDKRELNLDLDRSVSRVIWAPDSQGLYFQYADEGVTKIGYTTLNGDMEVIAEGIGGNAIGRPYGGGAFSMADNGDMAMNLASPYYPSELGVMVMNGEVQKITSLNEDLFAHRTLGEVEDIWYTSSVDGRELHGWVIYPPNYDENNTYPLMVEIHGGPISHYGPNFTAELQLFAADGYAVFYPNMRGSTSYGEEFGNLLYHDYPGDDYHDIMDGVDLLIEEGITTEDSLFVTGGSAGGIMTAWIIGTNNRFESAAVVKPVMNWISKTLVADNYYGYAEYRYPGQPWESFEEYWKYSPVSLVGNIQTPTLVMVGTNDLRTPLSESKQLYNALQIREIETVLVEIPGASHSIANRPSQLITKVDHILAWFRKYR
ncbi:MAG: S9 family peptidase [Balneolales bacterium]|nr:S9 family peptidase [Balneolales bacterium]